MPYASVNPATGDFIAHFAYTNGLRLDATLDRAVHAVRMDWGVRSSADRAAVLFQVAAHMRIDRVRLARLATLEMGKLMAESLREVDGAAELFEYHAFSLLRAGGLERALSGSDARTEPPAGVIFCMETWNFPFLELARVVAPNLAVGNAVIVQHSHAVPVCAAAVELLASRAGLPAGALATVFLPTDLIERAMQDGRIHAISVHGYDASITLWAGATGKPVEVTSLPPSGTDVFAVLDDADLALAATLGAEGRLANCGQMCSGAKRFLVMDTVADEFIERLRDEMEQRHLGDPLDSGVTLGPLSSRPLLYRALNQIESALRNGAHVVTGGSAVDRPGFFLEPTILGGVGRENPMLGEDIAAPVAMVVRIRDDNDVVALANRRPRGIGGSILTSDRERALGISRRIESGTVYVNETVLSRKRALGFRSSQESSLSELPVRPFVRPQLVYSVW